MVALLLSVNPDLDRAGVEQLLRATGDQAFCPAGNEYAPCDRDRVNAAAEQRQLLLPVDDNYFCRSLPT